MDVLEPGVVGIAGRWHVERPARVLPQPVAAPVGDIEGRVGKNEVGPEVRQFVLVECALVVPADIGIDAAHREVHPGEPPGGVVALQPVDGNVADVPAMFLDEFLGLHEHAAGAAARIVHPSLVGLRNLHQQADHGARRVELAAALAFGTGETAEEILVDPPEDVA